MYMCIYVWNTIKLINYKNKCNKNKVLIKVFAFNAIYVWLYHSHVYFLGKHVYVMPERLWNTSPALNFFLYCLWKWLKLFVIFWKPLFGVLYQTSALGHWTAFLGFLQWLLLLLKHLWRRPKGQTKTTRHKIEEILWSDQFYKPSLNHYQ